eukprot:3167369-Heterocapsa_arctica.AAC.1
MNVLQGEDDEGLQVEKRQYEAQYEVSMMNMKITNKERFEEPLEGEDGDQERECIQQELSGGRPAVRPCPLG